DAASSDLAGELGLTQDRLRLAADPVVRFDPSGFEDLPAEAEEAPRPWLGVALRQWEHGVGPARWEAAVAAALDRHLAAHGGTLFFMALHRAVDWPLADDAAAAARVRERMARGDACRLVPAERPWRERAALLAGCDAALAMRLHGALFALAGGVPTVGLVYDPKVRGLFASWGCPELALALAGTGADEIAGALERALAAPEGERAALRSRRVALAARERENAAAVRALLAAPRPPGPALPPELLAALRPCLQERAAERPGAIDTALSPLFGGAATEQRAARRVAILTNRLLDWQTGAPCFGGAERYALELARWLSELGLDVTFFQRGGPEGGRYFGFPVVPLAGGEGFSEFEPGTGAEFHERSRDFDHVLYLMPNYASGPLREDAVVVCHGVWWDHDLYGDRFAFRSPEWTEHLRRVFARPRRVVAVDLNSLNVVRALFPEAAPRLRRIPSWVDIDLFRPPDGPRPGPPLVLLPRRAEVVRGTRLVAPVLAALAGREARFRWLGDGYEEELAHLRAAAARDPRLQLATAPFEGMPAHYREAEICVLPTVGSEGLSLACLEAMASGCAVVATDVGGLGELVQHEVNGLLCRPEAGEIAAAIGRLLDEPELRERLQCAARATAERHSLATWREGWRRELADLGWIASGAPVPAKETGAPPARPAPSLIIPDDPWDVVCFSIIDWEFRWQRPQQIATELARRGRRVFYVRSGSFLPPGGTAFDLRPLGEKIWEIRLPAPQPFSVYDGDLPPGAEELFLAGLKALGAEHRIERAVSLVDLATWTPVAEAAARELGWGLVYDCMDDWATFPGIADKPALLARERELVSLADLVVVSSGTIRQRWAPQRDDLLLLRNAADFAHFQAGPGEDPLPEAAGPVAGYFGAIAGWFDVALLAEVATARPHVTFALLGEVFDADVGPLAALPNVLLLGHQPYDRLPAFLRRFDACLVPFEVSPATDGMDVVKVYEYLSLGKPVVTTPIREIVHLAPLVRLAADAASFGQALDAALAEDDPAAVAARIRLARANTWARRVDELEREIGDRAKGSGAGLRRELAAVRRTLAALAGERDALRGELAAIHASRLWRSADLYWRLRRALRGGR
ncbi:MAG: glycosyltransferase, partial [Thermoanaerobaculia bacterium]|nr:glycosyltransferase [Thermoanaerobaculia bacterium]